MRCSRCGAEMPPGMLRCGRCGAEIRIVPDYNPLDEVLAAQVKGSIDGSDTPLDRYEYKETQKEETKEESREQSESRRQMIAAQKRRQAAQRKRARKRKRRIRAMILTFMFLLILGIVLFIVHQFSYSTQISKGDKAFASKDYEKAQQYYIRALGKDPKRGAAYEGLTKVYLANDSADLAESLLLKAVDDYSDSPEVLKACFDFYITVDRQGEIPLILDGVSPSVAENLSDYTCQAPVFSLNDEENYDDVQQLSLESDEKVIYYTTDGSDPFYSSSHIEYKEPVQISEGDTEIRACSVNKKGIPSLTVKKSYKVELPIVDAPAVSPSTGQYDDYMEISIIVPEGYTAYYTMDGTEPDAGSEPYYEPVEMPEGSTIFKAVLVNARGKLSGVTTRNYELTTY